MPQPEFDRKHPLNLFVAEVFEEGARRSGLGPVELTRKLAEMLNRPGLSRQTVIAWRKGEQGVPHCAAIAIYMLTGLRLGELAGLALARMRDDPDVPEETVEAFVQVYRTVFRT